jgi:crotonobetainyl-CoA:carnitine CoA-transferase CaiB-like acyl-CoA transferase
MMAELVDPRLGDPRYATQTGRTKYAAEIREILSEWLRERTREEAYRIFDSRGVPAGYVRSPLEIIGAVHDRERGFFPTYPHPLLGTITIPGSPFILERIPWTEQRPPELGEHTREVLGGILQIPDQDLERLRALGAV